MNEENENNLKKLPRPPVVVVMGHVDHGKTTLLDFIKKTSIATREAGGITQSIGAYEISHNGKKITFIDTPGHEAFTGMRSCGAGVADVAILVVAADDGVKPQTKECLDILLKTKTPFVVAINKTDKNNADIEKTKQDLLANSVLLEGFGGNISWQEISAKTGTGIPELLDLVVLTAELEGLNYNPAVLASGIVLEVKKDSRRGNEVFVIIKNGTLKLGQEIVSGSAFGKIKMLENFLGEKVGELFPSAPAVIMGFESLPEIGAVFSAGIINLAEIKIPEKIIPAKTRDLIKKPETSLTAFGTSSDIQVLNLILKADTAGTLEALSQVISSLPENENEKKVIIISSSVGEITDGTVKEALTSAASIIGFRVKTAKAAENLARAHSVKIISSEIIYELIKSVEDAKTGVGQKEVKNRLLVLAVFNSDKLLKTIGGKVEEGVLKSGNSFEINRADTIIGKGKIKSLESQKLSVRQIETGKECGLIVELSDSDFNILAGDELLVTS